MDNIYDYILWKGELSFDEKPFCEIDALVLTELSYFNFSLSDDKRDTLLTLNETYIRRLRERGKDPSAAGINLSREDAFLDAAAKSKRFGSLFIKNYTEVMNTDISAQFCAVTFVRRDDFSFIAYRGTDDSVVGWKEDCMMSFTRIAAQDMALDYAINNIDPKLRNFMGGHSKGGNLALYASANLKFEIWDCVEQVYLFDSPGLCSDVLDTSNIQKVDRRATRIIPQFCVIGKLFEPDIHNTKIVLSDGQGLMQHDLLTWSVDHGKLNETDHNDPQSEKLDGLINEWMEDLSRRDRRAFVNELFDSITNNGYRTLSDISQGGMDSIERILFSLTGTSSQAKKAVAALPEKALFGNVFRNIRKTGILKWFDECQVAKSLILIVIGLFFVFASSRVLEATAMLTLIALAAAELVVTVKRLIENKWNFLAIKERLYLLVILVAVCVVAAIKDDALFMLGSLLYGTASLILSFRQLGKARENTTDIFLKVLHFIEAGLLFIYGVSFLVIPNNTVYAYSLSIGIFLMLDGGVRLGYRIYRQFRPLKAPLRKERRRKYAGRH